MPSHRRGLERGRNAAGRPTVAVEQLEPRRVMAANVAVGSDIDVRSTGLVSLVDATSGAVLAQTRVFEAGFRGGVRVAMGDVDGNGTAEVIAASGPGRVGEIRVFKDVVVNGKRQLQEMPAYRIIPFGNAYRGGVEIGCGDVDGNGREDFVAAMSRGGGTVNVFRSVAPPTPGSDPVQRTPFRSFTPFGGNYDGGASVAVADLGTFSGGRLTDPTIPDNKVEIIVGSGVGMRATVRAYDVSAAPRVIATINPFSDTLRSGVSVAAGRYNADAIDDIFVSAGRGGGGATEVFSGSVGVGNASFGRYAAFAGLSRPNAPVFTAPTDVNGDGRVDTILATQGDAGGTAGIEKLSNAAARTALFSTLKGPLRIATARTFFTPVTTSSGLQYRVVTPGTGSFGAIGKLNTVDYTGTLLDGRQFDSSRVAGRGPFAFKGNGRVTAVELTNGGSGYTSPPTVTFPEPPAGGRRATGTAVLGTGANAGKVVSVTITDEGAGYDFKQPIAFSAPGGTNTATAIANLLPDRVIQGWNEMLPLMRAGGRYRVIIPANLAYGNSPLAGSIIPNGATLVFDMELKSVV
jgi:FKBP-type peptidyl-prolyl cis-trans isomerase